MSIHVCKCPHNSKEEFHLRYPGMSESAAQELADCINAGYLQIGKSVSSRFRGGIDLREVRDETKEYGQYERPEYFATLEAAVRDRNVPVGTPGAYRKTFRDDPEANEFRATLVMNGSQRSIPLGEFRDDAERWIETLNHAFEAGLEQMIQRIQNPKARPILIGRTGYLNRDESTIP